MTDTQIPPQWTPTEQDVATARLTAFARWVERRHGVSLPDYHALWRWSVDNLGPFWQDVWDWFDVRSRTDPGPALDDATMPGAVWFPGARLNYAEHVLRYARDDRPAIVHVGEDGERTELTWADRKSVV